jgi:hypothetical protein
VTTTLSYLAMLFRAEAARLVAEADPGTRLVDGRTSNDRVAGSLTRMADRIERTDASGVVEEV